MNFVTFTTEQGQMWGLAKSGGVVALSALFPDYATLRDVIAAGHLAAVGEAGADLPVTHPDGQYRLDPPVPNPGKILCVGVNFPDRNEEYRDGAQNAGYMSLFPRFAQGFVGHGAPLVRPPESEQLDYEGEIAVIIGRPGRRITEAEALDHIAGLTICNEGTIRDWLRHGKFNVTQGKNWDRSGAMGPWMVPFTDPAQILDVRIETRVNGELRQSDRTGRMLHPVARQIAYISTFCRLEPGDIIVTGTPTGAGARFDPPIWLRPGDKVEITVERIGTLRNGVCDE